MLTEQRPLMGAFRRSCTFLPLSSPASNSSSPKSLTSSSIPLRSGQLVVASSSSPVSTDRGGLRSPWSQRRRRRSLLPKQWRSMFNSDGQLLNGGVKFLKKVRSGGVDPSIRAEVWPFLLGVYDMNSTKEERDSIETQKRKDYGNLRRQCRRLLKHNNKSFKPKGNSGDCSSEYSGDFSQLLDSNCFEEGVSLTGSFVEDPYHPVGNPSLVTIGSLLEEDDARGSIYEIASETDDELSDTDSCEEDENVQVWLAPEGAEEDTDEHAHMRSAFSQSQEGCKFYNAEGFSTWQRIIRLDAMRTDDEWIMYSPSQAALSRMKARRLAESVGLKDYDHLETCRIAHAARLVAILEAYALYDSETGYCQGMSDLLSPIISVIQEDYKAFWCFVGFMRKARHNFRLDESGIRRQLNIVSKIIKCKDSHLYNHLEKLEAEDCCFVYRMVVVLFRRELNFEQTLGLWEVMWADQAAIRVGISMSAWGRGRRRLRAPPTDDLLLYAIAACVLQRRKLIMDKYSSMDEIMRECHSMAGQLDVRKLLRDAHDLVVTLHGKI